MLQLLSIIKLLLFGLLLEKSFGNIEDEPSKENLKVYESYVENFFC